MELNGFAIGDEVVLLTDPERRKGKIVGFDRDTHQSTNDIMHVAYNDHAAIPIPRYKWDWVRKS